MEKISLQGSFSFLISVLILLACSQQSCCCNYTTYNDALIPVEHPVFTYTISPLNNQNFFSFGFWSLCIPQQTFKNYPQIVSDYISSMPENGQLLFLIQGNQKNLVLGYIQMNMESRQVIYKIVIFGNPNQILEFRFTPVEFEEEWILSLITINFEMAKFTVEMTGQIKQSRSILNQISYEQIVIGGQGYIEQGYNLSIFKGRLSKIQMSYQIDDVQNQFKYMNENCRIPLPQEGQQTVYFIKGLKIFEGSTLLLYTLNQFGNRYCLSGWVKYDTSRVVTEAKYNLIRMSLFKTYNYQQRFGDEIFQIVSQINKAYPTRTQVSVFFDLRNMPIMGERDLNFIIMMSDAFYVNSDRYLIGLQQWHFIKYEYGSKVLGKKSYVQIQFFNELGLQERILNNISPINSPFYINIGADDFYKDILQASIFDFKFEYNYKDDKQILFQVCHYSCQTCRGPLENHCITCNPQSNRYYLEEINKCECQQGYINVVDEPKCVDFSQIFPLIKIQEVFHLDKIQCQFGYFLLPNIGGSVQCVKWYQFILQSPQSNFYNLMCVDCLYSPYTWYLKPICKFDMISSKDSPKNPYSYVERDEIYQDLYLIDNQGEINLHEGILDFCELESNLPNCFMAAHKHLNKIIFIKCKPNHFELNGNCVQVNPYCLQASAEGKCLQYQDGMYLKNDQLYQCPSNCELCNFNEETQSPYCLQCQENFTLDNGQCISCGNYCKFCQKYYDFNSQNSYSYFRCYKCVDDSKYFISFDAINCQKNTITNCKYAFQALSNNYQINTLDLQFIPRQDWENIITTCALCNLQYGVILDSRICLRMHEVQCLFSVVQKIVDIPMDDNIFYTILDYDYYTTPQGENITIAGDDKGTMILTSFQHCIISKQYFIEEQLNQIFKVIQFAEKCEGYVKNCEVCLRDRAFIFDVIYSCLDCEKGYYADRVSGKCYQCPLELNCYKCQSQQKNQKDGWKKHVRAFYYVVIQKNTEHTFRQFGQSDNQDDYEIVCSECGTGYELRNEICIPACPESCLECQYINGQNLCVKCSKNQKGRKLSLSQNQCIDCPLNCALCRVRSKDEILSINPLFDNNYYISYTYQCLKSFNDAEYYYDQDQGIFIQCSQYQYCNYELILTLNLYCSELEYEQALNQLSSQYEQSIFKQQNLLLQDLVSGTSFKEFENDLFYHQANEKSIRTIILNISSVKEQICKIPSNGLIQQVFSKNIFSTINVEITINFNNNTIIEFEKPIKFLNFNKVSILGAIFHPISNDKLKQIIFDSVYPQTILLQNIVYQQMSNINDQSSMLFINVQNVVFDNFKIMGLIQYQIENFIEIAETVNQKSIKFLNVQILNSFLYNQVTINCHLNQDDNIYIDNFFVNSKFNNATLIKTGYQKEFGYLQMQNIIFQIDVLDCLFFLNLYSLRQIKIKTMTIENSEIQNSTLIILNNNNYIDNFMIQLSRFKQISYAIMNSNQLTLDNLQVSLSNIMFQLNEYHQSTKFISFQKYNNNQSQIEINKLKILNNYISQNNPDFTLNNQYYALLYLQLDIITIIDLEIERGYGLIDISINNVQILKIKSTRISQGNQYKFLGLHQFMDCQLQQVKGELYLQSLFVSSVVDFQIDDLIIRSTQTYNSPILYYKSQEKIKQQQFEKIQFSNSIIESNLILLTNQKFQTAILFFESVQETTLYFSNITFYGNVLHEYLQNKLQTSALLLNLNCILGTIIINDSNFIKNIVLNSTDSIIYIKSEKLVFHNCTFSENSLFNYALLQPYLLWGFLESQQVNYQEISSIFKVKSSSGNGKLLVEHLDIQLCILEQSIGYSGGAFLIEAQKNSIINIINSQFNNISTEFQRELGFGGSIYLDGTSSQSLNVTFQDLIIQNIYANEYGGFLYITTGTSQVRIQLNRLTIQNVYAKVGSIIYATFSDLQQSSQEIEFNEISIKNTQEEYINYLNQYTQLSKSEEMQLINNRVLFLINSVSKVRFTNVYIENIFLESALSIQSITEILIKNLIISNSLINSNLIKISANTYQDQILQLSDIQISNITTVFKLTSYNCETNQIEQTPIQFACIKQSAPISLFQKFINESITYGDCILQLINNNKDQIVIDDLISGLILFLDLTEQTTIKLYQVELVKINCQFCLNGLIFFQFQKITKLLDQQYLTNIMISNSLCGRQGCLNIEKSNINNRRLQSQEKFIKQLELEFLIDNYICQYNSGINGTCLYISNVKVEIQNCLFQFNQAYQAGGAIYVKESEDVLITNSWILNNQAKIGGGLYLETLHDLDYKGLQTKISNNSATSFGDDIVAIPQKLTLAQYHRMTLLETIQILETDNILIEQVQYTQVQNPYVNYIRLPSGQTISSYVKFDRNSRQYSPLNQIFRIIAQNRDNQVMKNLKNTYCTIESRKLNTSNNNDDNVIFSNNLTNIQKVIFNESSQDYNLDDLIVYFDNKLPSNIVLQLQFWCNSIIIPIYNKQYPYNILNKHSNYHLRVNIKTFECQYGEIKNYTDFSCIPCDNEQGFFSLTIDSQKCEIKDDLSTISVQSALLNLKAGYWRPYFENNQISYCINKPENCEGGFIEGNVSCLKGHIGALCEECDLYAIKEEGPFSSSSKYSCVSCQETSRNYLLISFVSIWTLISILISVQSNLRSIKQSIRVTSTLLVKVAAIQNSNLSGVLIKMLTNYLQIMASIATFKLKLPIEIQSTINTTGSPVQSMTYSMDCFLSNLFSLEIQYARLIWQIIMPFAYISFFFTCYLIAIKFKFTSYNKSVITTTIIYMYIYLQTSLVGGFAQLISYRNISGYYWIQANVSYRFDTSYHYQWILQFCLPMLILLSIIIPSYFLYGLRSNSANLDKNYVKSQWGYLYNEYTNESYYWELIKIAQKQLMIICLIYYDDNVILKATMIALIIGVYLELTLKQKPYNRIYLNKLDCQIMNVCLATIILAAGIYISEQTNVYEIKFPYFVLIAIMNFIISYKLISNIVVEYCKKAGLTNDKIDQIKQSIRKLFPFLNQIPFMSTLLIDNREKRKRTAQLYMKLKQYLLPQAKEIISFKNSQSKPDTQRNFEQQICTNQLSLRSQHPAREQELLFRESLKQSSLNTSKHIFESTVLDKLNFKRNEQLKAKYDLNHKKMTQTQLNMNEKIINDNKEY